MRGGGCSLSASLHNKINNGSCSLYATSLEMMKYFSEQPSFISRILLYGADVDSDDFGLAGSGSLRQTG